MVKGKARSTRSREGTELRNQSRLHRPPGNLIPEDQTIIDTPAEYECCEWLDGKAGKIAAWGEPILAPPQSPDSGVYTGPQDARPCFRWIRRSVYPDCRFVRVDSPHNVTDYTVKHY